MRLVLMVALIVLPGGLVSAQTVDRGNPGVRRFSAPTHGSKVYKDKLYQPKALSRGTRSHGVATSQVSQATSSTAKDLAKLEGETLKAGARDVSTPRAAGGRDGSTTRAAGGVPLVRAQRRSRYSNRASKSSPARKSSNGGRRRLRDTRRAR
jgi:hypothetical protein